MRFRDRAPVVSLVLLVIGYAALLAAWTLANPLGRAPDEPAHYLRALAAANNDLKGDPVTEVPAAYQGVQAQWVKRITRNFDYPARLAIDPNVPCPLANPTVSAACQRNWPTPGATRQSSNVGSYQPYAYVPIGEAIRAGGSRWTAFIFGRGAVAAGSLFMIALAAAVLWQDLTRRGAPQPVLVLGLLCAVTPMAIFLGASLNPNGLEIAAAVTCAIGLLSVLRPADEEAPPRGAWLAFGAGGTVLVATRSLGPYFVVAFLAIAVLLVGLRRSRDAVLAAPRAASVTLGCVGAAAVLNVWWEVSYQPHFPWTGVLDHATLGHLPRVGQEMVGTFGWLEWHLAWPFYALWGALVLALVVVALAVGTWTQRGLLLALIAGCVAFAVAFDSVLPVQTGYGSQGRYFLPLAVAIPLLAAEIIRRSRRFTGRSLAAGAVAGGVLVAVLQFTGWYLNARRYAVGTSGPRWFASHAQWSPTWGWPFWIAVAVAGSLCLAGSVAVALGPVLLSRTLFEREPARAVPAQP